MDLNKICVVLVSKSWHEVLLVVGSASSCFLYCFDRVTGTAFFPAKSVPLIAICSKPFFIFFRLSPKFLCQKRRRKSTCWWWCHFLAFVLRYTEISVENCEFFLRHSCLASVTVVCFQRSVWWEKSGMVGCPGHGEIVEQHDQSHFDFWCCISVRDRQNGGGI